MAKKDRLALRASGSGRITGNPEITLKMEFCPDGRQSNRNSEYNEI
jgi:hypothetical protein